MYILVYNHNDSEFVLFNMNKILEIKNVENIKNIESKTVWDSKRNYPKTVENIKGVTPIHSIKFDDNKIIDNLTIIESGEFDSLLKKMNSLKKDS